MRLAVENSKSHETVPLSQFYVIGEFEQLLLVYSVNMYAQFILHLQKSWQVSFRKFGKYAKCKPVHTYIDLSNLACLREQIVLIHILGEGVQFHFGYTAKAHIFMSAFTLNSAKYSNYETILLFSSLLCT
jgi:hypothetical protein